MATHQGEFHFWELVLKYVWRVVVPLMNGKHWADALASVGLAAHQEKLFMRTKAKIQLDGAAAIIDSRPPTLADLDAIFRTDVRSQLINCFSRWSGLREGHPSAC